MMRKLRIARPIISLPMRKLFAIPYGAEEITAVLPAFGHDYFSANVVNMEKDYGYLETKEPLSFREPTTVESIAIASYAFKNRSEDPEFSAVISEVFGIKSLQAGRIVKTSEGVYVNPPLNAEGNSLTDEAKLKAFLHRKKKVNDIYILGGSFSFVPYETFKQGVQEHGDFIESGLARGLEHTVNKKAEMLAVIANPKDYSRGVNIYLFDHKKTAEKLERRISTEPLARVVNLNSSFDPKGDMLFISGDTWDAGNHGFAFAVFDSIEYERRRVPKLYLKIYKSHTRISDN